MLAPASDQGGLTFRVPPTGEVLGASAIGFVDEQLAPDWDRDPGSVRYAVSYVDDVYGRSVAEPAPSTPMRAQRPCATSDTSATTRGPKTCARSCGGSPQLEPDVLFVSAYLDDAIALRRELVRQDVPLLANIGTSSSYCMPEFGETLGADAVGVYASDKPSGSLDRPVGAAAARARRCWHGRAPPTANAGATDMSPAALAGFSAAWALVRRGAARRLDRSRRPTSRRLPTRPDIPSGTLPNGSGLRFGEPGHRPGGRQHGGGQRDLGMGPPRRGGRDLAARVRHPARRPELRTTRGDRRRAAGDPGVPRSRQASLLLPSTWRWPPGPPRLSPTGAGTPAGRTRPRQLPLGRSSPRAGLDQRATVTGGLPVPDGTRRGPGSGRVHLGQPGDGDRGRRLDRAQAPGKMQVELTVTPLDPATLPPPGDGLAVVRQRLPAGSHVPALRRARPRPGLSEPFDIILVYPSTSTLHATTHEMLFSPTDETCGSRSRDGLDQHPAGGSPRARRRRPGVAGTAATPAPAGERRFHDPGHRAPGSGGVRDADRRRPADPEPAADA